MILSHGLEVQTDTTKIGVINPTNKSLSETEDLRYFKLKGEIFEIGIYKQEFYKKLPFSNLYRPEIGLPFLKWKFFCS
jgi:hypothetical protein